MNDYLDKSKIFDPKNLSELAVVVKSVERCNINCTYCYFFNAGEESYKRHPKYIAMSTVRETAEFLRKGVEDLKLRKIRIIPHGGEPMMQRKAHFAEMCTIFQQALAPIVSLEFMIQTNGTLVDDEWISLFSEYDVSVGVSLDGPKKYNDTYRLDHQGRSTYDRVVDGLRSLQEASQRGEVSEPSIISVINLDYDPKELYRHFAEELNVSTMEFLTPDLCYDNFGAQDPEDYGKWLCDLFDEWAKDEDRNVNVRIIDSVFEKILHRRPSYMFGNTDDMYLESVVCVASNGDLAPNDDLRVTGFWATLEAANVATTSLSDLLTGRAFGELNHALHNAPDKCRECSWLNICAGGRLVNRYSEANRFNNPSILCEGLRDYYTHVFTYLTNHGYAKEALAANVLSRKLPSTLNSMLR